MRRRGGRWLHARLVYPLALRLRGEGSTFRRLEALMAREREPEEEALARQRRSLSALLTHCAAHCPYYQDRWDLPGAFRREDPFDVLASLPVLTRKDLQRHADAIRASPPPRRVTRKTTGGSTGEPVTVWKDAGAVAQERAAAWLAYGWFGVEIGDRGARFWGSPTRLGSRRLRYALADAAMRRMRFSAFAFDDEDMEGYWRRCLRARPRYFYGYVSMLTAFADFLARRGHDGRRLDLKVITTTAEALTAPQRTRLQEVFGAPVQNEYGCGEMGPIAYECEAGSLHVLSDNVRVEVLRPDGTSASTGESGQLVVTDLHNRAMPLVRYRIGDNGVQGRPCACGRGFPVLERVWGREYEFVEDRAGRRFHGEFFMYLFEELRDRGLGVERFRVRQTGRSDLDVEVEARTELSEHQVRYIREYVKKGTSGLEAAVRRVASIGPAPSGKSRIIVNDWMSEREDAPRR